MGWTVQITKPAARDLRKLDKPAAAAIAKALHQLANEYDQAGRPVQSDVKRMQGSADEWRLRVGVYRVIFRLDAGALVVLVLRAGHRREIYRG